VRSASDLIVAKRAEPDAVVDLIPPGADVLVPLANGEPRVVVEAIDGAAAEGRIDRVRIHQMHAGYDHPYLHGVYGDRLRHVSYFLSAVERAAYAEGGCHLVPSHFSDMPRLLRRTTRCSLLVARAAPPDRHGFFSLGTNADYVARFLGEIPVFLEVNPNMPRTFGENNVHVSQIAAWCESVEPLLEIAPAPVSDLDRRIAELVAERIPDRATIQVGIGGVPNALMPLLTDHHDLGIHTEMLTDGLVDLIESGAATGLSKTTRPGKVVTTFALGTQQTYDYLADNPVVEMLPVDWVNDPRVIGREQHFVSINATIEVDFLGQCNSEIINGRYWSGSGGQADFARGAMHSPDGQGFVVLHAATRDGSVSRIVPRLSPGAAVTTDKNTVDKVVTEYGVAELRGRTIGERTTALIGIAHPDHREDLLRAAHELGYLRERSSIRARDTA
jgi:acyl-CoA hydrolase